MPTALLTGAYGSHGSIIRIRLEASGWKTVAMVREPRPGDRAVAWTLGEAPPTHVLRECDALIHCAYDSAPRKRHDVWNVNVEGSSTLLETANRIGVPRVLVLSSMSAYAGTTQVYGQARLAIEDIALRLGGIAVRPGLLYGNVSTGMVAALVKLTRLPLVPVLGAGARQFPVHEDDLGKAILDILDAPAWTSEVFGIAQSESLSFRDLLSALAAREGGSCRFVPIPWRSVYFTLRFAEMTGASLPLRADSVLGLVRPARSVLRSKAFPGMIDAFRILGPPQRAQPAGRRSG